MRAADEVLEQLVLGAGAKIAKSIEPARATATPPPSRRQGYGVSRTASTATMAQAAHLGHFYVRVRSFIHSLIYSIKYSFLILRAMMESLFFLFT